MRLRPSSRLLLVCLAIGCLTVSLATRFTTNPTESPNVRIVQAQSSDAERQHLLGDGIQWIAPTFSFALFVPQRSVVPAESAVFPPTNLLSESWLYNRPPPIC